MFLRIYDWIACHRRIGAALLMLVLGLGVALSLRIGFKEEITDFLPVDEHYRRSMQVYQEVASANKVVLQFRSELGSDSIIAAVDRFGQLLPQYDTAGWIARYEPQMDYDQVLEVMEFVYAHLPYLLDESDYQHLDSLWQQPDFFQQRFSWIRGQLSSLTGTFMMPVMQYDPLGIGNRLSGHLRDFQPQADYVQHNGYLFTPDGKCCLVTLDSPFGSSESNMNGRLADMLNGVAEASLPQGVTMRLTGAPIIAVGNARQIKTDTLLALSISVLLILGLLFWSFRSLRSLLYIALSTSFGFLVALAGVALLGQHLSFIVIGIASVIIGIAVNYPLHFVCHSQEVGDGRKVLADLVQPLLVGNVTTVAAFLTLVPLQAVAIRQLGMFSALMLVGTILFVLIVMPHISVRGSGVSAGSETAAGHATFRGERLVTSPLCLAVIVVLTMVLGWFSLQTTFDSDFSHLNYMTSEQRADMQQLQAMQGQQPGVVVYLPAPAERMEEMRPVLDSLLASGAVLDEKNASYFMPSQSLQQHHLQLWQQFWRTHDYHRFFSESRLAGFSEEAFEPFQLLIEEEHPLLSYSDFAPLTSSILTGYVSPDALVARLTVPNEATALQVESVLPGSFDLTTLNSRIANTLTLDFNYIGMACACIVFLFLWFSFGRIELALLAFTPMVVGWLWILGLMQLLGIQFNIVNIILATFIFGQGDDYTIFITEGLIRDYKRGSGRHTLVGYQRSILLSAAIMLAGIGSLIVARHPAMHSLAEVTIIGMTVVVLMAWILPPMLFHWLIRFDKSLQKYLDETKDL